MMLVAALWGCTNPFLARGAAESTRHDSTKKEQHTNHPPSNNIATSTMRKFIPESMHSLLKYTKMSVLVPYIINQSGSIVYYYTLATCNLSIAVPCCNALSLAFASITSYLLGERVDRPVRAILGSFLVTIGVAICIMQSSENHDEDHIPSDGMNALVITTSSKDLGNPEL